MNEISRISTKGQVVIPLEIRKDLGLEVGTQVIVSRFNEYVVLKKASIPDLRKEFEELTKWGVKYAKMKGIKSEKDVVRMIHEHRGVKSD